MRDARRDGAGALWHPARVRSFTDVKVFSVSTYGARLELSDRINEWLAQNRDIEIVDKEILQSSDASFHCYTLTLFFVRRSRAPEVSAASAEPGGEPSAEPAAETSAASGDADVAER